MRIEAVISLVSDDSNSYPDDLKVEVDSEYVTFKLEYPTRTVTIEKTEFDALVRYINV